MKNPSLVSIVSNLSEPILLKKIGGQLRARSLHALNVFGPLNYHRTDFHDADLVLVDFLGMNGHARDAFEYAKACGKRVCRIGHSSGHSWSEVDDVLQQMRNGPTGRSRKMVVDVPMPEGRGHRTLTAPLGDIVDAADKRTPPPPVMPQPPVTAHVVTDEVNHRAPAVAIVQVPFRDGSIPAVQRDDGIWVILKPLCESLQLDPHAQSRRIMREPWGISSVAKLAAVGGDGRVRDMEAIRADMLAPWLFGVQLASVAPEKRPALEALKLEGAKVLSAYFTPQAAKAAGVDIGAIGRALVEADERFKRLEAAIPEAIAPVMDAVKELDGKLRLLASTTYPGRRKMKRGQLSLPVSNAIVAFRQRDITAYTRHMIAMAKRDEFEWLGDRSLFTRIHGRIWQTARTAAKCKRGFMSILGDEDLCRLQGVLHSAARAVGKSDLGVDIGSWTPDLN